MPTDRPDEDDALAGASLIALLLTMSPRDAIALLRERGVLVGWRWQDDLRRARDVATTMRQIIDLNLLGAVRAVVRRAIGTGLTGSQLRLALRDALNAGGMLGRMAAAPATGPMRMLPSPQSLRAAAEAAARAAAASAAGGGGMLLLPPPGASSGFIPRDRPPYRLAMAMRTQAQQFYSSGRYAEQVEQVASHPVWQYIGILDLRIRPTHRAMHGRAYMANDPIWRTIYPANGYNCRCRVRSYTLEQARARGIIILNGATSPPVPGFPDKGWSFNPGSFIAADNVLADVRARASSDADAEEVSP